MQLAPVGKAVGRVLRVWVRLLRGFPVYAVVAMVLSVAAVLTGSRAVLVGAGGVAAALRGGRELGRVLARLVRSVRCWTVSAVDLAPVGAAPLGRSRAGLRPRRRLPMAYRPGQPRPVRQWAVPQLVARGDER